MKLIKYIFLLFSFSAMGQFNTLNYVQEEKEKETNVVIDSVAVKKEVKNKKKFKFFGLFGKSKNKKLKSELDSLKGVISEMKSSYSLKQENLRLKDSILYYLKNNKKETQGQGKELKKLSLIKEKLNNFHFPIKEKLKITSNYGIRLCPFDNKNKMHYGIDLRANYTKIYAVLNGSISAVGYDRRSGNYIKVKHSNNYETIYTHLSHIYYKKGEKVKAGFVIGKSGNSGKSTAPHLHFAVKENGKYINPVKFLNKIIKINNLIATVL